MLRRHTSVSLTALLFVAGGASLDAAAAQAPAGRVPSVSASQVKRDSVRQLAAHVLSRLTFGPRHGEVDRVTRTGIDRWIEQQLDADTSLDRAAMLALAGCDLFTEPVNVAVARLSGEQMFVSDEMVAGRRFGLAFDRIGFPGFVSRDSAAKNPGLLVERANNQIGACRIARVEASEKQLLEVMTDFWANHFSVHYSKFPERGSFIEFDRVTIRPNALGRFRDLLGAVARSPSMLSYLDNALNAAEDGRATLTPRPTYINDNPQLLPIAGLNENYARELLELHTMGVDGGFTQTDVMEVARAFTGWTHRLALYSSPREPTFGYSANEVAIPFVFDSSRHDAEQKTVLGRVLAAGRGMQDGEDVLDMLAAHPSTAKFIARKLAVRFVSDSPPEALVEKAAAAFTRSKGNIREVLRAIFFSSEFRSPVVFGAKLKSPLEYVLSTRRAFTAPVDTSTEVIDLLLRLEQPPFGHLAPDGWPEVAGPWLNVGSMKTRLEIARRVADGEIASIPLHRWPEWSNLEKIPLDAQADAVIRGLLNGRASQATRDVLGRAQSLREIITIALSSPEFQRR